MIIRAVKKNREERNGDKRSSTISGRQRESEEKGMEGKDL
jgi:hypothetical protein